MVIKNKIGFFEVLKNVRDAYNETLFEEHYIEEIYDKYEYLVLDMADSKIRIKGFESDTLIMDYVVESCNFLCPYTILKRVDEAYYTSHKEDKETIDITKPLGEIETMECENFDKDSLVLETSAKEEPHIYFDAIKYSGISLYPLPSDLVKEIEQDKKQEKKKNNKQKQFTPKSFDNKSQTKVFTNSYSSYSNKN